MSELYAKARFGLLGNNENNEVNIADSPVGIGIGYNAYSAEALASGWIILQANCSARREWGDFSELARREAEKKSNQWIHREMTVGKNLKPTDCFGIKSDENYQYLNTTTFTGQWKRFVVCGLVCIFLGDPGAT